MKVYDNGTFYRVYCSSTDVQKFKQSWPCSGLPTQGVGFVFDRRNGDLVDIVGRYAREFDGPAAVALSEDAQTYGKKKLRIAP